VSAVNLDAARLEVMVVAVRDGFERVDQFMNLI
jgi:hypothetical protein